MNLPRPHFCLALLASVAVAQEPATADRARQLDLRVLYAGEADAPRTAQWRRFLGAHCRAFEAIELGDLGPEAADRFDVVIVDAPSPYKADGIKIPRAPKLGPDYSKPTILMGAAGGSVLNQQNIKLDWL